MAPTLDVAVTITKAGPVYEGDCSQRGSTDVVKTIDRELIEGFRLIGIDPAGSIGEQRRLVDYFSILVD